jgi:hypothetical protein
MQKLTMREKYSPNKKTAEAVNLDSRKSALAFFENEESGSRIFDNDIASWQYFVTNVAGKEIDALESSTFEGNVFLVEVINLTSRICLGENHYDS